MGISFGSINTGLPKDIVQQIIEAERIPLNNMENQKEKFNNKIKLLDQLIDLLGDLRKELEKNKSFRSFRELKSTFREDLISVDVDKNIANTGSYQFEVLQLARKSSALSNGFKDPEEVYLGVGFFSYELPDGSKKEIYIDSDHANLNGLAKLINEDMNSKMTAKVINDGSGSEAPWKLLLTFQETGNKNKITFPHFYFIDGEEDFSLNSERVAQNAKIKLDGFEIEVSKNKINDLIPGVTIDLKKKSVGDEFTINIDINSKKIGEKVSLFVEKINAILKFINDQNSLNEKSDTSKTLGGDITLTSLARSMRSIIFSSYPTDEGAKRIGDVGITFKKDGLIDINIEEFESIVNSKPSTINQLMNGLIDKEGNKNDGFIDEMSRSLELALRLPDGLIVNRKKGVENRIKQVDRRIEQRQRMIDQKEKNLKRKFAKLESTISQLKSQGAGLQAITGGRSINPVTKLG